MIEGPDGLYLHDSIYTTLEVDLPYAPVPRTRVFRVRIFELLSPRFRSQYISYSQKKEEHRKISGERDFSEEVLEYQVSRGGGQEKPAGMYSFLSLGIVGYSSSGRERAWRNEIDMYYAWQNPLGAVIPEQIEPRSVYQTGPSNRFSSLGVMSVYVGQIEHEHPPDFISISIHPKSTTMGARNILDISRDELLETAYGSIGRGVSYGGAVYNILVRSTGISLAVAPTKEGTDPLIDLLKAFRKELSKLLNSPDDCVVPDPPLESRNGFGVMYEVSPTPDGGRLILETLSAVLNDGMILHISATERLLPLVVKWVSSKSRS